MKESQQEQVGPQERRVMPALDCIPVEVEAWMVDTLRRRGWSLTLDAPPEDTRPANSLSMSVRLKNCLCLAYETEYRTLLGLTDRSFFTGELTIDDLRADVKRIGRGFLRVRNLGAMSLKELYRVVDAAGHERAA